MTPSELAPGVIPPKPEEPRVDSPFHMLGAFVFAGHLVLGALAMLFSRIIDAESWWTLAPFCLASLLSLAYLVTRTLQKAPRTALYEMGLFLAISCAVYYAFGPLLYVFGPGDEQWYPVSADQSVWLCGMNFVGVGLAGIAYIATRFQIIADASSRASISWSKRSTTTIFLIFAIVGFATTYLVVLPFELGLISTVPSNITRQLGRLAIIAIIVGWAEQYTAPRWMMLLTRALVATEFVAGVLMFNKTMILLPVLATALGRYVASRKLRAFVSVAALGAAIYIFIVPIVTYCRIELNDRGSGEYVQASLPERLDIVYSYFENGERPRADTRGRSTWWQRLNYLSPQQAAIDLKQAGNGGTELDLLPWIFVPRTIYPDKPEITVAGKEMNEKVTGVRTSSVSPGIFIDGYYQYEWLGLLVTSLTFGLALRIYASISESVVRHRAFVMYPIVFNGVYTGLRADGWWLADVLAS